MLRHEPSSARARCGLVDCVSVYVPSGFAIVCVYSERSPITSTGSPDSAANADAACIEPAGPAGT
ncbi:hypothetical protein [Streptomyces lunaelactis]|uniref:hypothetical protein n=1 Tax=Streptomyces lunaelactis TaxID=1535768 RepID=UPI0020C7C946|nr:hypothetical protein [Streptomyces lunaelactis]